MPISSLSNAIAFTLINLTQAKKKSIESMLAKKSQEKDKKRALTKKKFNTICLQKISASNKEIKAFDNSVLSKTSKTSQRGWNFTFFLTVELIRSGKQQVTVTSNAVENTLSKMMRFVSWIKWSKNWVSDFVFGSASSQLVQICNKNKLLIIT